MMFASMIVGLLNKRRKIWVTKLSKKDFRDPHFRDPLSYLYIVFSKLFSGRFFFQFPSNLN